MPDKKFEEVIKTIPSAGGLKPKSYILYAGAIQPRKNLDILVEAFEKIKEKSAGWRTDLKLVLAGAPAWKYKGTLKKIAESRFSGDIIITGTIGFDKMPALYRNAKLFVFPSLYEGFGIPVLEAMASGIPVICARNSSLVEAGGEAALYFETENGKELVDCMEKIIEDETLEKELINKGLEHVKNFSWEKCAQQTIDVLTKW